ncbi:DUF192 domain-containing protein [Dokdonella sp.]|uniref:DUF192 domain-containing protein n=1 Tax=Dokdonella sp. TaxID=2291710 RepID=UPI0025C3F2EC|nr:DUF192 domain-containing protein [Dokdonella sp.]MBX3689496.1 DUF192 domain-containing protein [Dokdonella sp.]
MHKTSLALLVLAVSISACGAKGPGVELAGQHFSVEIADTDAAREHGLMDRTQMPADHGMLFIFDDDAPRAFWMKNTRIPLDMLFFDADRRLISVQHDAQPCTADPCPPYSSGAPARYVLELNGGKARALGVSPGDVLTIQR